MKKKKVQNIHLLENVIILVLGTSQKLLELPTTSNKFI